MPILLRRQLLKVKFTVLEDSLYPVFLGKPFLKQTKARVDHGHDTISITDATPLHAVTGFAIQPYSEVICQAKLYSEVPEDTVGLCSFFSGINDKGVMVAHSLAKAKKNIVPLRMYNATPDTITINRGERLATFTLWQNDTETVQYDTTKAEQLKNERYQGKLPSLTSITGNTKLSFDLSKSNVSESQRTQLRSLLYEYSDCFVDPQTKKLGLTDLVQAKITTFPDAVPVYKYPYRMAPSQRQELDKIIEQQVKQDLIEETNEGAWASPALLVKKPSGGFRLVLDFRALNAVTIPLVLRIPRLDDVLDAVGETKPKYFSVLDCTHGFHQIPLDPESRNKTGFIAGTSRFRYKTLPQGLRNASAVSNTSM